MTHDLDTVSATLWVILAVMVGWLVASAALVALVQRFRRQPGMYGYQSQIEIDFKN